MKNPKRNVIKQVFMYLTVLIVILQCYSLSAMLIDNKYTLILFLCVFSVLFLLEGSYHLKGNTILIGIGYFFSMLCLLVIGDFKYWGFLFSVFVAFLLFLFYLSNYDNVMQTLEAFTNVMVTICAISLFFFLFGSCLGWIQPSAFYSHDIVEWGVQDYKTYYHLYVEGQTIQAFGYSGIRNTAVFVEGPMLAYPLSFAIYYELFLREKGMRKSALIVMAITMITSFSTTGYLVLVIIVALALYEGMKPSRFKRYILPFFGIVIVAGVLYYILDDKFSKGTVSTSIRTDDIMGCVRCFLKNPIFGVGFENMEALVEFRNLQRATLGLSTGLGGIFAYGGILWGVWYTVPYLMAIKHYICNPDTRGKMGFVLLSGLLLAVTVVQSRLLCTMINAICWLFVLEFSKLDSKKIRIKMWK